VSETCTVVIPCRDDPRVLACVDSIDAPCETLVVVNGSSHAFTAEIGPALAARGAAMEVLPEANLSAALEHGVWAACNNAILFMDADCTFAPGSIATLLDAMNAWSDGPAVFKGEVRFDCGSSSISRLIARSRQLHTTAPVTAFKPPLLVARHLAPAIGGYFFDKRLLWKEDADLDWRLRQAGVAVVPVPQAHIRHAALDLPSDLRSNYRYGVGAALGKLLGIPLTAPDRSLRMTYRQAGVAVAAYMALANLARSIGYHWRLATAAVTRRWSAR